jgi:hypothetical protein
VFTFNASQLQRIGEQSFLMRMREILAEQFPDQRASLASPEFEPTVLTLVERAATYGLGDEQSAATFVLTAWLLGTGFDTDFPGLQELLTQEDLTAHQKCAALEAFAQTLLDDLRQQAEAPPAP